MTSKPEQREKAPEHWMVLVGNPNVGKSVIFGALTGRYATVSNYHGTTVEVSRGPARIGTRRFGVIDSPGVNSLVPMSEDERVTRDILMNEPVDSVLQVLDSKNLRRGLLITVQLIEMGLPVTLALNMYDEAGERGITIDTAALAASLDVELFPTIATQRWNIDKVALALNERPQSKYTVKYPEPVERAVNEIAALLPECGITRRSVALMIISGDGTLDRWLAANVSTEVVSEIRRIRGNAEHIYNEPIGYMINRLRLAAADMVLRKAVTQEVRTEGRLTSMLGSYAMHPFWGIPILLVVLAIMYEFVGVLGAGISVDFFESVIFGQFVNPWAERVVALAFPTGFVHDILVGPYGIVTMAFTYAIAIVLPIVGFFFIFFSFLEDSGYLPRLAIMVDKVFKLMGLNGKAVLPMVLGLGCDTMATMTTRILETRKERIIVTLLLALGVPCSAQLGVILGMLGSVSLAATAVWAGSVIGVMFLVGYLSSKLLKGRSTEFIIEIPPMRFPQLSNLLLKTLVRVQWYLKEAVPLFILGTLLLFALDKTNALAAIEYYSAPVIRDFLDLPIEATQSFVVGFLRRDYGAAGLLALQKKGMLDGVQVVVSLVTITLFVPCIANLFMIVKERGAMAALWMTLFIFPFAIIAGGALNFILRLVGASF